MQHPLSLCRSPAVRGYLRPRRLARAKREGRAPRAVISQLAPEVGSPLDFPASFGGDVAAGSRARLVGLGDFWAGVRFCGRPGAARIGLRAFGAVLLKRPRCFRSLSRARAVLGTCRCSCVYLRRRRLCELRKLTFFEKALDGFFGSRRFSSDRLPTWLLGVVASALLGAVEIV